MNSPTLLLRGRRRTSLPLLGLASAILLLTTGCGSGLADPIGGTAQVRFVAVAQGTPATDFYINGAGAAYGLGYESFTSYLSVVPGAATLAVHRNGAVQPLAALQETLLAGHQYTVLLGHGGNAAQERLYSDREEPAPAGQVALRVLNAMRSDAPAVFFVAPVSAGPAAAPTATFTLTPGEVGGYAELPAGAYTITAVPVGASLRLPLASLTVKARSGAVRTLVFAGAPSAETHKGVVAFTLSDADPL